MNEPPRRVAYITAGAGGMFCGSCLNDNMLTYFHGGDLCTRECLALNVDRHITSEDVIDTLAELFAMRGVPDAFATITGPT